MYSQVFHDKELVTCTLNFMRLSHEDLPYVQKLYVMNHEARA